MNNEEIRKLLGGYATNTLTESERSALFEAALDDQDLFNALQDEQALKELLADPASRQAIRHALEQSLSQPNALAWWSTSTRWMWGGAIAAAVATLLIVAVIQRHRPQPEPARRVEVASNQKPAKQEQAKPLLDQEVPKEPQKSPKAQPPPAPLNARAADANGKTPERPVNSPTFDNPVKLAPQRAIPQAAAPAAPAPQAVGAIGSIRRRAGRGWKIAAASQQLHSLLAPQKRHRGSV